MYDHRIQRTALPVGKERDLYGRSAALLMVREFQVGIGGIHAPGGTHVCHFGGRARGTRIAADVIAAGLAHDERCLLVGDDPYTLPVLRHLRSAKVDVTSALKLGKLVRVRGENTGVALLGRIVSHLGNQSRSGVRLVGFPGWNKPGWPSINDLLAFEALLEQVAGNYSALYFCIYDRHATPLEAMYPHPKMIVGEELVNNSGYISPPDMRQRLRFSV